MAIINHFFHNPNPSSFVTSSEIKNNKNSPIARDIQTQNNNYYYKPDTLMRDYSQKVNNKSPRQLQKVDKKDEIEISIQLKNELEGYELIKVDGKEAKILPNSTPANPRLLIDSKAGILQTILIVTKKGDTCILKRIFDKNDSKNYPIRFIPDYQNKNND